MGSWRICRIEVGGKEGQRTLLHCIAMEKGFEIGQDLADNVNWKIGWIGWLGCVALVLLLLGVFMFRGSIQHCLG